MNFFVGGVRSGKSGLAESWLEQQRAQKLYLATGLAQDAEMAARIQAHKARRGNSWQLLEEDLRPEESLKNFFAKNRNYAGGVLVDCLSAWLANMMDAGMSDEEILGKSECFFKWLSELPNPVALVSLECGMGIIAESALARRFGDLLGEINQRCAFFAENVIFSVCGLPLWLKVNGQSAFFRKENLC